MTGAVIASEDPQPTYDNRAAVLRSEMRAILDALGRGDERAARARAAGFALPQPRAWMDLTFGPAGERLTADYAPLAAQLPQMVDALKPLLGAGPIDVSVERFTEADDAAATGYQIAALAAMTRPVPLYSVRLSSGGEATRTVYHVWSFVDVDGQFRWIGKLRPLVGAPPGPGLDPLELRVRDRSRAPK